MGDGESEGGGRVPSKNAWQDVPHYYGDIIRQLMLGAAALMLFASPFYENPGRPELPLIVIGTVAVVGFAALTNPWKKSVLIGDAIVTGVGMVVYQWWALDGYDSDSSIAFVLREALAVIYMFAFYFSVKTVRAMILHQVGKRDSVDEFVESEEEGETSQGQEHVDKFGD